jgi:phenylalanyl-tRNA synthetase alpha chain
VHRAWAPLMAADLTGEVLYALSTLDNPILSQDAFPSYPAEVIKTALDRLGSREMVEYEKTDREDTHLTAEGEGIAKNGSHEARVFEAVRSAVEGLKIKDLPGIVGPEAAKVSQGRHSSLNG